MATFDGVSQSSLFADSFLAARLFSHALRPDSLNFRLCSSLIGGLLFPRWASDIFRLVSSVCGPLDIPRWASESFWRCSALNVFPRFASDSFRFVSSLCGARGRPRCASDIFRRVSLLTGFPSILFRRSSSRGTPRWASDILCFDSSEYFMPKLDRACFRRLNPFWTDFSLSIQNCSRSISSSGLLTVSTQENSNRFSPYLFQAFCI